LKAVVFDLFHTLTAREEEWGDLPWTSDHLGIPRADWYRALTQGSRERLVGQIADPVEIVRRMAKKIRPDLPEALIAEAAGFRVERFRRALAAIPCESLAVLDDLRRGGYALGLISNCDCSEMLAWEASPLRGRFDVEVFSCQVGCAKPEQEIYRICLERLGVEPSSAMFVGDGGSGELEGARAVGMHPVLFSGIIESMWPERIDDLARGAAHHIRRLQDIWALLEAPAVTAP
jgi:putative hydrolase of the HAD superfamily